VRSQKYLPWFMVVPAVAILLAFGIYPLIYSFRLSLHSYSLLDPSRGINYVGLENFRNLLVGKQVLGINFSESLWITLIFGGTCLILEVVLGLGGAVMFSRKPLRSIQFLRITIMIPMLLAPVVVGNIWRYMYQSSFGLINFLLGIVNLPTPEWLSNPFWSMISLIIADIWEWTPFSFLVLLAAILSIPVGQLEAASVDGATGYQQFLYITLPGITGALLIIVLIRGIELIRIMDLVYILTYGGPGVKTAILPFNAYMLGFKYFEIGKAAAYAYLMVVLINVFIVFFVRTLRER